MKKLFLLLITIFLAWLPNSDAQFTITGEDITVCDNGTATVDVSFNNFVNITSAQFAITWDPDVVSFVSVSHNMPATALFNTTNAPLGELRFSWFDATPPPGYTAPGPPVGFLVGFTITFNIVGDYSPDPDNFTAINFGSVPGFPMEVANTGGIIPNGSIVTDPGSVSIDDNTAPVVTCPPNQTVTANFGMNTAQVSYPPANVTDNCNVLPAVCSPASGSMFPVGNTTVTCNATDAAGNSATPCSFTVTVNPAPSNPNALTTTATSVVLACGDTEFDVPIRVKNFDNMTSMQYALVWDDAVIEYDTITDSINATGHGTALYNVANTSSGQLRFSWFDSDGVPGENLPDSTVIFTLHFTLLDDNDLPDTIRFSGLPGFPVEFSNTSGIMGPMDFVFQNAIISLENDTIPPSITCPPTQTAFANASCIGTLADYRALATVTDNCSDPADITITQTPPSGTTISDTTTVTLIATDEAGLKDTCTFTVNLVDNTPPSITCPANITVSNDLNACTALVILPTATATDNCTAVTITDNGPATDLFPVGVTTVTFTATDGYGNASTCQMTVTVNDTLPPVISCSNISVSTDTTDCSKVVFYNPSITENCAGITLTCIPPSGTTFPLGDSTVVCIVEDAAGLSDTCTFVVTVYDGIQPAMQCPADTTILVPVGTVDTVVNDIYLFFLGDNCGTVDTSYYEFTGALTGGGNGIDASGTVFPLDTTTVTYFAEDDAGNLGSCSFNVVILEDNFVTLTCSADQTVSNDSSLCEATIGGVTADATPAIFVDTTYYEITGATTGSGDGLDASGSFNVGTSTVTFTAISTGNDTVTCQVVLTVNDTLAPIITCTDISVSTDTFDCTAVVNYAPAVTENCPGFTVTCIPPSGTTFPVGDSTVVCIVEDAAGLTDTCTFVVTVFDGIPPALQCPTDTTIVVPVGTVDTVVNDIFLFFLGDNCGTVDTTYYEFTGALTGGGTGIDASGTAFPLDTTTVTYYGVDDSGNIGSCSFNVVVEEDVQLTLTCSANQSANNDPGLCEANLSGVTADAQPVMLLDTAYFEITGATTASGTGLDASGNFGVGTSTVTFTAISTSGDTLTCSLDVTVTDNEPPVFDCPAALVSLGNTLDSCGLVFEGPALATATDNCPGLTIDYSIPQGALLPIGTYGVLANAIDAAGNLVACVYQIEVNDTQAPSIANCPAAPLVQNNDAGQCGAVVAWTPPVATDNCSLLSFTVSPLSSGDFFPVGNTTVTYTAVDDEGNVATCIFDVTVNDAEPPALSCPTNLPAVPTDLNLCSAFVNFQQPTATDNCSVVSFGPTTFIGPEFDEGTHTVSFQATDAAGNTTTCSFTVEVVDNQFPFIPNMPADITVDASANACGANVDWALPGFPIDNCGIDAFDANGGFPGDFFAVGTHEVKYIAIDVNGNVTVETLTITVEDNEVPTINCPTGLSISVDGGTIDDPDGILNTYQQQDCENIVLNFDDVTATDACGLASLAQTAGLPSGSSFPVGTTTMTFVATDAYGNESICSFDINVLGPQIDPATVFPAQVCEGGSATFEVGTMQGASILWTDQNGNQVSTGATFTIFDLTTSNSGVYTAYVSLAFCDLEFTTELFVAPAPDVSINANDLLCANGLPLTLEGVDANNIPNTTWEWEFPNGATPDGQIQVIQNPTPSNSGVYTVTATTAFGCTDTESDDVLVSLAPVTPALYGTKSNACVGDDIVINGPLYTGGNVTYTWFSEPSTCSGLDPINNPIVNVQPVCAGTYTYYLIVEVDGCVSDTGEWVVNVQAYPTIDLDIVGQTTCVDGTTDVTLIDNGTGATTWSWTSTPFGDLSGDTESIVLQDVTDDFDGIYTVTASTTNGCSSTASIPLDFTEAPDTASLVADPVSICQGGVVTLNGTPYGGALYIWTGPNLPANSASLNALTIPLDIAPGTYTYTFSAEVGDCVTNVASVDVTVTAAPTAPITIAGNTDCVDGTTDITISTTLGFDEYVWSIDGIPVFSGGPSFTLEDVTSANSGVISVDVTTVEGCTASGIELLDITDGIQGLVAIETTGGCGDELQFEATAIPGANYLWSSPTQSSFSTQQNPTVNVGPNFGEGTYTVTASNGVCSAEASVVVDIFAEIDAVDEFVLGTVDLPQSFNVVVNDTLEAGQPYTITVMTEPGSGTVTYDGNGVFTYTPNAGFWGTDNMVYEICYENCPDKCDFGVVTIQTSYPADQCVVTTVITPNEDGINDNLVVSCLELDPLPDNTMIIFNEWGDKVYEAAPYANEWQGTYDGKNLPDGTYFYIFQRDANSPAQKGFVTIYR